MARAHLGVLTPELCVRKTPLAAIRMRGVKAGGMRYFHFSLEGVQQSPWLPGGPRLPLHRQGSEAGGVSPAYHIHLHQQDPQGEALAQALQPLVDVVRVEVVVAEAGKGRGRTERSRGPEFRGALPHANTQGAGAAWPELRLGEGKRPLPCRRGREGFAAAAAWLGLPARLAPGSSPGGETGFRQRRPVP